MGRSHMDLSRGSRRFAWRPIPRLGFSFPPAIRRLSRGIGVLPQLVFGLRGIFFAYVDDFRCRYRSLRSIPLRAGGARQDQEKSRLRKAAAGQKARPTSISDIDDLA